MKRYPAVFRPFVSAYSHKGVTITAPPSVLAKLRLTPAFRGKKIVTLPVHVPSHAPHLFTSQDIDSVLDTTLTEAWASYYSQIPLVSCSTAKLLNPGSFGMVLRSAVDRSLRQPVHLDTIVEGLPEILLSSPINHISLISVGPRIEGSLSVALRNSINSNVSHGSNKPTLEVITPKALDEESSRSPLQVTSKIAICGLGGRFPDADSPEALWNLLYQGRDVVAEVPPNRWDIKSHVDSTGKTKNTSSVPWGCWIRDPGLFDARFFGISPKEAPAIDPAQRIALMATQEAMDNAGIVVDSTPSTQKDRIGVYLGVSSNDWCETNSCQQIGTHSIVGGIRPFISGRVNYCFKFGGPSYVIDTACSSSLAAIQLACNALRLGDVDTAVAGGTNVITNPDGHAALDRGFFLSKTGNCKTFDDNADGYCRGEGVGVVILKRLEDALQDGDPIQVVIADIKTNHSAEADSITRPHPPTQMALFDKVLSSSRTSPVDVSYIEMHGTGTQHGDAAEMTSCLAKFAPNVHARPSNKPLYIGSTKANIGHGEAVSGVSSLAKVIFMMQHNTIPPHAGIKTKINHHFPTDLKERNIHIAMEPTAWPRGDKPRVVLLNNFSAPGGNTAMILEEPPTEQPLGADDPRTSHVVCVSAKCATSLSGNLKSIIDYIDGNPAASDDRSFLANLSYTTTARRQHHAHRVCVSGHSMGEIRQNIQVSLDKKQGNTRPIAAPKLVFAFTGQGSQYAGMGKHLMSFSTFRKDIRHFNQISQMLGYPSFEHVFLDEATALDSCSPIVVQLAMVSLEMALARLYILWGLRPDAVVGHSLGEYAALNIAGVLSDADTIYLVGERARLLQAHCRQGSYALLAVKLSVEKILEIKAGKAIEIACINGPDEVVVGGQVDELSSLKTTLKSMGTRATFLEVQYAFHTSQVDPILPLFLQCAQVVSFKYPRIQIISPLLGGALPNTHVFDANYLMRHCRETVNIHAALTSAYFQDRVLDEKSVFLEIGAQPVVSRMAKASLGKHITAMHSLQHGRDLWPLITDMLAHLYCSGHEINWASYQRDFKGGMRVLKLPAYSWDLKDYWIQYVEDWALRKGDPLPTIEELQKSCQESMESRVKAVALQAKIEGSTTVHNIVKEESNNDSTSTYIVVQSDVSRPDLLPIVQGHFVNGIPLCTPVSCFFHTFSHLFSCT
jgi:acyl transferase domain-containing protein